MLIATQHHLLKESLVRKKLYFTLLVTLCHAGLSGPCMMAGSAGEGHPEATGGVLGSSSPQEAQSHLIEEIKLPAGLGGCQEFRPRQREGRFLKTQVSAGTFCHQDWMLSSCSSSLGGVGGSLKAGRKLSVLGLACFECPSVHVPTQQGGRSPRNHAVSQLQNGARDWLSLTGLLRRLKGVLPGTQLEYLSNVLHTNAQQMAVLV